MEIEKWPLETVQDLAKAHRELNGTHLLAISVCGSCGDVIGVLCTSCDGFVSAVDGDCGDQ